jgi:hypothetical protein
MMMTITRMMMTSRRRKIGNQCNRLRSTISNGLRQAATSTISNGLRQAATNDGMMFGPRTDDKQHALLLPSYLSSAETASNESVTTKYSMHPATVLREKVSWESTCGSGDMHCPHGQQETHVQARASTDLLCHHLSQLLCFNIHQLQRLLYPCHLSLDGLCIGLVA